MSRKLYPPNIGGTIPAFCGTVLTVPFSMNKAVGKSEIGGFALKIKTVNGEYKGYVSVTESIAEQSSATSGYDLTKFEVKFDVSDMDFTPGQYYKIQLAYIYIDGETIGYYSTVGVVKYTTMPTIGIDGLKFGHINIHNYTYTGVYSQLNGDTTEKMYSYRFQVFNGQKDLIEDTGYILHNTSKDDLVYEQHAVFPLTRDLNLDESYYIQFSVKTTNNLEVKTSQYRIMQRRSVPPDINAQLKATNDFDNGLIRITIQDDIDPVISGSFVISRASDKSGWMWEEFRRFDLRAADPKKWELLDCTVEQGVKYRYSLQQYNDFDVYSDRIVSNDELADFEDSFLYDGEKQLKIRFNPQVSSFQTTILESKMETIGSKYPFITRNGSVGYKDIPISGLISYQMDDAELFMTKKELGIDAFSHNLTSDNITAERMFKIAVMEWLSNGKPKLFKTPTEGNFVVYLMGVSLSPENGLGRMLHSFSCTATEIGDFNLKTLDYYNLIDISEELIPQIRWVTIDLARYVQGFEQLDIESELFNFYKQQKILYYYDTETESYQPVDFLDYDYLDMTIDYYIENKNSSEFVKINTNDIYEVSFMDMLPGSKVKINDEIIQIGNTGVYSFKSKAPITYVGVQKSSTYQGTCTYSYQTIVANVFNNIQHVEIIDVPIRQFIGTAYQDFTYPPENPLVDGNQKTKNILEVVQDSKNTVLAVNFIKLWKRPLVDLYVNDTLSEYQLVRESGNTPQWTQFYTNMDDLSESLDMSKLDPLTLYPLRLKRQVRRPDWDKLDLPYFLNEGYYVNAMSTIDMFAPYTHYALDGATGKIIEINEDAFKVIINEEEIELKETEYYYTEATDNIKYIENNPGVFTEISYCRQLKTYGFEINNNKVKNLKNVYLAAHEKYLQDRDLDQDVKITDVLNPYQAFITELNKAITEYKIDNGLLVL